MKIVIAADRTGYEEKESLVRAWFAAHHAKA